ncbi:MAG: hypothetical protein ACQEXJ_15310 [Myxococcota bacterium]
MMRTFAFAIAVLMLVPACRDDEEMPPEEEPVAEPQPDEAPAPSEAPGEAPPPPEPQRRERAGIETGAEPSEARDRPPAAVLIPSEGKHAPPLRTGAEVAAAQSARRFLTTTWRRALQSADADAFQALLSEGFSGYGATEENRKVAREEWAAKRIPPIGDDVEVTVSPPEMLFPAGNSTSEAELTFQERAQTTEGCVQTSRELTIVREGDRDDPDGGWRVTSEDALVQGPCPDTGPIAVAAAHEELRRALAAGQLRSARRLLRGGVLVWDEGLETVRYKPDEVIESRGRWLKGALTEVEADEDNTRSAGLIGWVEGPDGHFVYRYHPDKERYRLTGIARHLAEGAEQQEEAETPAEEETPDEGP